MSGQRILTTVLKLTIATVVVLGLTACAGRKQVTHKEAMNAANQRWLSARSGLLLQSAQRQFDTGDLEQCERTVTEGLTMDPGNARLHTLAGRIALERGLLERAYHRFDAANELDEDYPDAFYFKGIVLQRWQRYDQALEAYRKAFDLETDNVAYLLSIAEMHVALDELDAAKELLESKIVYFDQNAGIRVGLAHVFLMKEDHEQAEYYLQQALLLQPDDLRIMEELALVQLGAQKYEAAMPHLEQLCESLRDRLDLRYALANCYLKSHKMTDARDLYLRLTREDARNGEPWVRLGEIAFSKEDLTGALQAANRAISLSPERHEGYLLAGMVWQKRGGVDQALRMFDNAAKAAPDNALPLILRGLTLERAGRRDEAIDAYAAALRVQPQDRRAQRLLANVTQP